LTNYTTNERVKKKKYEYLFDSNGRERNIFSKGFLYNLRYYFHFIKPSKLEVEQNSYYNKQDV
jgi:hypothetical protein